MKYWFYQRNSATHILSHVGFWLVFFLVISSLHSEALFQATILSRENMVFNFLLVLIMMFNHYFYVYALRTFFKNRRWAIIVVCCILIYAVNVWWVSLSIKIIADFSPENIRVKRLYDAYIFENWKGLLTYKSLVAFTSFTFLYSLGTILTKTVIDFYRSQQEKLMLQQERNAMEVNFLRMQIQPHFLFNSLNNIYGMVIDNTQAADSITKLSDLLRFSVEGSKKEWITLREEVVFLTDYIELERIRHRPEKVNITYDFSEVAKSEKRIKPLLLVNFIENAFKHGVNATTERSSVSVLMKEDGDDLLFSISNSKPQRSIERPPKTSDRSGVGLINVRRRLELEYPERHTLTIRDTEDKFAVDLLLQLRV